MKLLFAYSTLMDPHLDEKILGHKLKMLMYDYIADFKIINTGNNFKTLVHQPGGMAMGKVLICMDEDWAKLDAWESRYIKHIYTLQSGYSVYAYILSTKKGGSNG